jgi:uroporphyrinogen-III decarboxylase
MMSPSRSQDDNLKRNPMTDGAQASWIPVGAQMHDHVMTLTKTPARVFYSDAKVLVDGFQAVGTYYNMDAMAPAADVYNAEAEAMGQQMIYSDNAMPTIDHSRPLIQKPGDLLTIKRPDWKTAGRIPFFMDIARLTRERGLGFHAAFCAPFSLAVGIRSYPLLVRDMRKNPAFTHDLFTFLVDEILTPYLKRTHEVTGMNIMVGADAWAAFPNLTPPLLEEWVVPYAHRLRNNLMPQGIFTMLAASGDYCEEDPSRFDETLLRACLALQQKIVGTPNFMLFMGRWQDLPLEPVENFLAERRKTGDKCSVAAGINARLLRDGPIEGIVKLIKRFIHILGRQNSLNILMANIPADTPPEHVHAAVAAVHTFGRFPLAEDLDAVEFEVPDRESFEEYLARMSQ